MAEEIKKEEKSNTTLTTVKYVYILVYFALLSGLFYPIINKAYPDKVFTGMLVLLVGLSGALTLYKSVRDGGPHQTRGILIGGGIMFGDFMFMLAAIGSLG